MNPVRLFDLVEDVLGEVVSRLDPPSTLALALSSKTFFKKYFRTDLFGPKIVISCIEHNEVELCSWALNELGAPFCVSLISPVLSQSTSPRLRTLISDILSPGVHNKVYLSAIGYAHVTLDFIRGQCVLPNSSEKAIAELAAMSVEKNWNGIREFCRGAINCNNIHLFRTLKQNSSTGVPFLFWDIIETNAGDFFQMAVWRDHLDLSLFFYNLYAAQRKANGSVHVSLFSMILPGGVSPDKRTILDYLFDQYKPSEDLTEEWPILLLTAIRSRSVLELTRLLKPTQPYTGVKSVFIKELYMALVLECLSYPSAEGLTLLFEVAPEVVRETLQTSFLDVAGRMDAKITPEFFKLVSLYAEKPMEWVINALNGTGRGHFSESLNAPVLRFLLSNGFKFETSVIPKLLQRIRSVSEVFDVFYLLHETNLISESLTLLCDSLTWSTVRSYLGHNIMLEDKWKFEELVAVFGERFVPFIGPLNAEKAIISALDLIADLDRKDELLVLTHAALARRLKRVMDVFQLTLNKEMCFAIESIGSRWKREVFLGILRDNDKPSSSLFKSSNE